ncbi:hypothetical protein NEMBOFW57_007080 [Staphylotrichum longicolle]|uniref:Uncharacterized protein n=1 Tax=Staphylotrichum longicolle TaxID=669026 RepID=A0AAD4I050_9PEZI|nr:hypothetical protein NEMBOFW57_007080 [Staphylotrichum longicolle]
MDAPDDALPARPPNKEYPSSFLFFVVTKLSGQYRQLAVAQYRPPHADLARMDPTAPLRACLRLIAAFSDTANRTALQGELALADAAYAHHGLAPPRSELPAGTDPRIRLPSSSWRYRELGRQLWNRAMVEFPFVMTCLVVSAGRECNTRGARVTAEPLGRVYNDETLEYGMVVVDISDLDRIRYGLVTFGVLLEASMFQSESAAAVCERVPRQGPGAGGLIARERGLDKLDKSPLVSLETLEVVWREKDEQDSGISSSARAGRSGPCSLSEQVITALVSRLVVTPDRNDVGLGDALLDAAESIPNFPDLLRRELLSHAHKLHQSPLAAELLQISYSGQSHLDWVTFSHLSPATISAALASPSLAHARSISLCIDQINSTPAELVSALTHKPALTSLYLHQTPTRQTDDPSAALLTRLASTPSSPHHHRLFLTGLFSAPSAAPSSSPPPSRRPPPPRSSPSSTSSSATPAKTPMTSPPPPLNYQPPPTGHNYHLATTPLSPARFATGFLALLRALATGATTDHHGAGDLFASTMCCAPPALEHPFHFRFARATAGEEEDECQYTSRVEITPLPCENRAVPLLAVGCGVPLGRVHRAECWPLVRGLEEGKWSVVVDVRGDKGGVGYAFVSGLQRDLEGGGKKDRVRVVGGLGDFLKEVGGEVDGGLVARLEEVDRAVKGSMASMEEVDRAVRGVMAARRGTGRQGRWVEVLGEGEARGMVEEFLEDSRGFGRMMLRVAMLARPEGRRWYPELLEGEGVEEEVRRFVEEGLPRPTKIYRSLIPDEQAFRQHDSADSEDSENSDGSDDSDGSDMEPLLTALFPH